MPMAGSVQLLVLMMNKVLDKTTTASRALEQAWITGSNITCADL